MQFWEIQAPDYESDYKDSYINGSLEHPYGLPGIDCNVCGNRWGGGSSLPFECPEAFRQQKCLKNRWPIPSKQHKALQGELITALKKQGATINELNPGDNFQPAYLDVPSKPRADFLWCGVRTVVVSRRIKDFLESESIKGIQFIQIHLRKIGKREPWRHPPISNTGEPEDLINEVPLVDSNSPFGPYFELIVSNRSKYLSGEPVAICSGCGRKSFPDRPSEIIMPMSAWGGAEMFYVGGTGCLAITDTIKRKIQKFRPTNIQFRQLPQEYSGVVSLEEIAQTGTPAQREFAALLLQDAADRKQLAKALADQARQKTKR